MWGVVEDKRTFIMTLNVTKYCDCQISQEIDKKILQLLSNKNNLMLKLLPNSLTLFTVVKAHSRGLLLYEHEV
jgi:hypothetical protein